MRGRGALYGGRAPAPAEDGAVARRRPGPSLRARAVALLANREHSPIELQRKLSPHAESAEQLASVLDELRAAGYLSEARFAESLVRRRAERYGQRRIAQELDGHDLPDAVRASALRELAVTERERALDIWRKRFGHPPEGLAEKGRQYRFLAQRGFDGEVISWVLRRAREGGDPA